MLGLCSAAHFQLEGSSLSGAGVGVGEVLSDAQERILLLLTLAQADLASASVVHAALELDLAHSQLFHDHRAGGVNAGVVIDQTLGEVFAHLEFGAHAADSSNPLTLSTPSVGLQLLHVDSLGGHWRFIGSFSPLGGLCSQAMEGLTDG